MMDTMNIWLNLIISLYFELPLKHCFNEIATGYSVILFCDRMTATQPSETIYDNGDDEIIVISEEIINISGVESSDEWDESNHEAGDADDEDDENGSARPDDFVGNATDGIVILSDNDEDLMNDDDDYFIIPSQSKKMNIPY
jgi:hypothetical protein